MWFLALVVLATSAKAEETALEMKERGLSDVSIFKPQRHFAVVDEFRVNGSHIIASLREYPSELHLCSSSFIKKNALLTTARCIYGKSEKSVYAHCSANHLSNEGEVAGVKKLVPHAFFEVSPSVNDIGVVILNRSIPSAFVQELPLSWQTYHGKGTIYQWKFSAEKQFDFSLHLLNVEFLTNAKCSIILKEFVECNYICGGNVIIHQGSMDQGISLSGRINTTVFILGIFNREGFDRALPAEQYERVFPYVDWIKKVLANYTLH